MECVEKEEEEVGLADDKSYISLDEGLLRVSYAIESTIQDSSIKIISIQYILGEDVPYDLH